MSDIICYVDENNKLLTDTTDLICAIRDSYYDLRVIFECDTVDIDMIESILRKTLMTNGCVRVPIIKSSLGDTLYSAMYRLPDNVLVKLPLCRIDNIMLKNDIVIGHKSISITNKSVVKELINKNIYMLDNAIKILHSLSAIY